MCVWCVFDVCVVCVMCVECVICVVCVCVCVCVVCEFVGTIINNKQPDGVTSNSSQRSTHESKFTLE